MPTKPFRLPKELAIRVDNARTRTIREKATRRWLDVSHRSMKQVCALTYQANRRPEGRRAGAAEGRPVSAWLGLKRGDAFHPRGIRRCYLQSLTRRQVFIEKLLNRLEELHAILLHQ